MERVQEACVSSLRSPWGDWVLWTRLDAFGWVPTRKEVTVIFTRRYSILEIFKYILKQIVSDWVTVPRPRNIVEGCH